MATRAGLIVSAGNPHAITGVADLTDRLVARREPGAGTGVLLDQLLITPGTDPHTMHGPELGSHLGSPAVASGIADSALGLRATFDDLGCEFVPLTSESYDLILGGAALGAARPSITACANPSL